MSNVTQANAGLTPVLASGSQEISGPLPGLGQGRHGSITTSGPVDQGRAASRSI